MISLYTYAAQIIERPKLTGLGTHMGVQISPNEVAHNTPDRGPHIVPYVRFSQGRKTKELKRAEQDQYQSIIERVKQSTLNPSKYHLLDWNCESYAFWLFGDEPKSPQVRGVFLLAGIFVGLKYLS
jgi:hypothetical protein